MSSNRGGKRPGAGRKTGSGAFKEPTVVKRIPQSAVPILEEFLKNLRVQLSLPENILSPDLTAQKKQIPIASDPVRAGLLAPAEAKISNYVDFNDYLMADEQNTIGIYAEGNSMCDAGIDEGDLLIVQRNKTAHHLDIIIADINHEFTVKRLRLNNSKLELHPENILEKYPVIKPKKNDEINIVGVVNFVIKKV